MKSNKNSNGSPIPNPRSLAHPIRQFKLAKQTWRLIKSDKKLLIFPIVSNLIQFALLATAAIPIYQMENIAWKTNHLDTKQNVIFFGTVLLLFYLMHFFNILFKAALTRYAIKKLNNEKYSIIEGFKTIIVFLPTLFLWNNLMTSAGCAICVIENCSDNWPNTQIAKNWLLNLTWITATYFMVPVLLYETHNAYKAVKRSAGIIKNKWGNVLVSQINMRINGWGVHLFSLIPVGIAVLIGGKTMIIVGSVLTLILFAVSSAINSAIQIVLCAALYLFAQGNDLSKYYDVTLLKEAFKKRQ